MSELKKLRNLFISQSKHTTLQQRRTQKMVWILTFTPKKHTHNFLVSLCFVGANVGLYTYLVLAKKHISIPKSRMVVTNYIIFQFGFFLIFFTN